MKKERLEGKVVIVHEKGDGIRRRYRESLDESRFAHPRRGLVHHAEAWYLSDAPLRRPLFGIYAFAALAEDLMWRARFGRRRAPALEDVVPLFAETRRALQNALSTYHIGKRLTERQARSLRRVVERLAEHSKKFLKKVS